MFTYKDIAFDECGSEEEAIASYQETMDAALAAGFDPTKKPFMFTAGTEEEDEEEET